MNAEISALTNAAKSKLNHLLIIPDGCRRHARREFLADLFRKSKEDFRFALKGLAKEKASELETRIEGYANTGNDPLYMHDSGDILDSSQIAALRDYLLCSYRKGAENIDSIIRMLLQNETSALSIYGIQVKNLDRSEEEVYAMMKIEAECFNRWAEDADLTSRCKFRFVGDKKAFESKHDALSLIDEFNNSAARLEENSSGKELKVNILAPYDFSWEINQAIVNGIFNPNKLVVPEKVDLIIRTGNSKIPLSGALPCQAAHAQFISIKEYFPDCNMGIIQNALQGYDAKRKSGL